MFLTNLNREAYPLFASTVSAECCEIAQNNKCVRVSPGQMILIINRRGRARRLITENEKKKKKIVRVFRSSLIVYIDVLIFKRDRVFSF